MKYGINPFVETNKITDGVWQMVSPGGSPSNMYLVEGTKQSLLIDTGFGIGDLKGLVGVLTGLPITVVNTHSHGDHTNGNYQFDRVFIHEADLDECRRNELPESRARFAAPPDPNQMPPPAAAGNALRVLTVPEKYIVPFTPADLVPVRPYQLMPLCGGFTFDLGGGFIIEVIKTSGHTPGGICLLDKKRRLLFSGDSLVLTPTFIFSGMGAPRHPDATVEGFREHLLKLQPRLGEFDTIYAGHWETALPPSVVTEMIRCGEEIMADTTLGEAFSFMGMSSRLHHCGNAAIAYSPDRVYKNR